MDNMSTKKSKKPKAVVERVTTPATKVRRRAPSRWPAPLKRVTTTTTNVLKQCSPAQANEIANYLLETGMGVMASTTQRSLILLVLVQSSPMERLLTAIATYAARNNTSVDAVAATLIAKLGPDAVEEGKLN